MKGTKVLYKRVSKYSNKNEMIKIKIKKDEVIFKCT
jgi:hypothetical protein